MIAFRLILITLQLAHSAVVVIPAEHASEDDYNAFMEAHQEYRTPEQEIRKRPVNGHEESSQLLKLFADAQAAFIGADPKTSMPIFESIVGQSALESWSASERSILFQSSLRLAQQESGSKRAHWLLRSLTVAPDQKPNAELFPPPLVQEWEAVKERTPRIEARQLIPNGWQGIQVQGIYYDRDSVAQLPITGEEVHLRWISNRFQSYSQVVALTKDKPPTLPQKPWLRGECHSPEYSKSAEVFAERKSFFDLSCRTDVEPKADRLKFNPISTKENTLTMFEEPVRKPFYKSGWFWTGVGAAIVVAIVISQKKQESEREPSTTYGY